MKAADRKHGTKAAAAAAAAGPNTTRGVREAASAPPSAPSKPSSDDRYGYCLTKQCLMFASLGCAAISNVHLSENAAKCRIRKDTL